ncbi:MULTISPECIES: glycosyltransferase [unclassified Gordonia (in: high G+C Gram-positive bacteria)]|uniref:glycosyltransferase n=1 Tax=unclassified Gordonia (in: high G+C Gram-positive bacteria) TaxID=2657482 RepID=UPI001965B4D6|nr:MULTISPECIES: glycosyltransferase [unclassified Gordonia (in: high G+C Gram-positive bacteria)]MBN0974521.1 glycosyltransferase [Gordonia sp. BP-119]MBN0984469.1 glycosyltransferase [Gordonia sp. BP-94]
MRSTRPRTATTAERHGGVSARGSGTDGGAGTREVGERPGSNDDVTVLLSLNAPDGTTRFVDQIVSERPDQMRVVYFSWKNALTADYEVFHVHWPEWLVRHSNPCIRAVKYLLMVLFLARLTIRKTPVVRTLHNRVPHRLGSRTESVLIASLDRRVARYIALNPFTDGYEDATLIRHGHYRDRFSTYEKCQRQRNHLLFFGRIEPYKNVQDLIDQFEYAEAEKATLRIVGQLEESAFADRAKSLRNAALALNSVSTRFEFVPDSDLVTEVTNAHLVVLPYREMYNSGSLMVALSLGTPVLAPRTEVNEWIQQEVGPRWLMLYDELTSEVIDDALRDSEPSGIGEVPNLANRDWKAIALQHYDVYRQCRDRSHRAA